MQQILWEIQDEEDDEEEEEVEEKRVKAWWHLAAFELCFCVDFGFIRKVNNNIIYTQNSSTTTPSPVRGPTAAVADKPEPFWCFRSCFWLEPFDFHFIEKLFVSACEYVGVCVCVCVSIMCNVHALFRMLYEVGQ